MLRELRNIEGDDHTAYLRFSNHPIARTKSLANGEINVDLDSYEQVVGIEVLSLDSEELRTLADLSAEYGLSLSPLARASNRRSA